MTELKVTKYDKKDGEKYVKNDLIHVNSNKPEYGSLMLKKKEVTVSNGFLNKKTIPGFITGEIDDLKDIVDMFGLVDGGDYNKLVGAVSNKEFDIVEIEKLESELGEKDFGFKVKAKPSGEVLTKDGEAIYRKTLVVDQSSDIVSNKITHNGELDPVKDAQPQEFAEQSNTKK